MSALDDDALDRALARLPTLAPPSEHARDVLSRASARLGGRQPITRAMRMEPALLMVLAACHLGWALIRVYVFR